MKRIFSLLALMLMMCVGAWAQSVMPFEAASSATDANAQMYYIYQPGSQEYVKVTNGNILGSTFTGDQFIFVTSNDANLFYVYNKSCGKFLTYTQTTDNQVSTKLTSQSVVKLVDTKEAAKTWRFVQEGSTDCYDIFPGEVASPNGNTASWNFRGGPDYALNFYKASDNNSSWQILGEVAGKMRCANKVFSLPGKPFMHKLLPNDGDEVLDVENLPAGLELKTDRPGYKYIYGTAPTAGEYTYKVKLSGDKTVDVGFTVSPELTQPTPFMGVLTWNAFQGNINDNNIKAIADAFETFGLKELGYNYMCIDDQWANKTRTNGHLTWGSKFTDHAGVVDYVHNKGLKIGIYSDAGSLTCSNQQAGSYGYEETDAKDFLDWDFDLLKYDFCNATGGTSAAAAENAYKTMGDALKDAAAAKDKDFLFYMCEWGKRQPWEWGANTGATCWRATDDTRDYWSDTKYRGGVIQVLDVMKNIWAYQGVNRWNDADMLVVGLHGTGYSSNDGGGAGYSAGLTMDEARTNFALWCMFASPLTLSNNITNLDGKLNTLTGKSVTNTYYKEDLAIIRNKELIDVDQDPLGQAGEPIYDEADYIVFQKDMVDGSIALSITNLSSAAKNISVNFADLSALKSGKQYKMRDLWKHAYLDTDATSGVHKSYTKSDSYTVSVPSHATYVYRIQAYDAEDLTWTEPSEPIVPEPEPELLIDVTKQYRVYNFSRNNANYAWTAVGSEGKTYPLDNTRDDQVWEFEATGNAEYPYYIKSVSTGKYMKAIAAGGANVQLGDKSTAAMYNATLKAGSTNIFCFNCGTATGNYLFTDDTNRLDGWKNNQHEYFTLEPLAAEDITFVTELSQLSNNKVYAIQSFDRGGWGAKTGSDNIWQTTGSAVTSGATITKNSEDANQQWAILKSDKGNYYLYNVGQKKFFVSKNYGSDTKAALAAEPNSSDFHLTDKLDVINVDWKSTNPEVRWALSMKYNTTDYFFGVTDWNGQQWKVFQNNNDYTKNTDRGMYFSIEPVADFSAAALAEAMALIDAFESPCPISTDKFYMLKSKVYGTEKADQNSVKHICGYMDAVTVTSKDRTFDFNGYGSDDVTFSKVFQFRDADGDGNFNLYAEGGYMQKLQDNSIRAVATATDATAADFTITYTANEGYFYLIDANAPASANYRYAQLSDWWGFGIGGWNPTNNADNDARCQWAFVEVEQVTVPLTTIGSASYATLYAPYAVELPAGVKAYTATISADKTYLAATAVEGNLVPAGSAVILISESAATEAALTLSTSDAAALTSDLKGAYRSTATVSGALVLSDNEGVAGFYAYTGTNLNANKVYVVLPAGSNGLRLRFDGPTGIMGIGTAAAAPIYDLQGRRVVKAQNGLFIQNGKKVIK